MPIASNGIGILLSVIAASITACGGSDGSGSLPDRVELEVFAPVLQQHRQLIGPVDALKYGPKLQASGEWVAALEGDSLRVHRIGDDSWSELPAAGNTGELVLGSAGDVLIALSDGGFRIFDLTASTDRAIAAPPISGAEWHWSASVGRLCAWQLVQRTIYCHDRAGSSWSSFPSPNLVASVRIEDIEWLDETTIVLDAETGGHISEDSGQTWLPWSDDVKGEQNLRLTRIDDNRVATWGALGAPVRVIGRDGATLVSPGPARWVTVDQGELIAPLDNKRLVGDSFEELVPIEVSEQERITPIGVVADGRVVAFLARSTGFFYVVTLQGLDDVWVLPSYNLAPAATAPLMVGSFGEDFGSLGPDRFVTLNRFEWDPDKAMYRFRPLHDYVTLGGRLQSGLSVGRRSGQLVFSSDSGASWYTPGALPPGPSISDSSVLDVVPAAFADGRLVVGVVYTSPVDSSSSQTRVYYSDDDGLSWSAVTMGNDVLRDALAGPVTEQTINGYLWLDSRNIPGNCFQLSAEGAATYVPCELELNTHELSAGAINDKLEHVYFDSVAGEFKIRRGGRFLAAGTPFYQDQPVTSPAQRILAIDEEGTAYFSDGIHFYRSATPLH